MIRLRGHHLLCIQGFQGYGYSEKFTENMKTIHSRIMADEDSIQLVTGPDDLCKFCPNLINDQCKNQVEDKKIMSMDRAVLDKVIDDEDKMEYLPSELFKKVNDSFKTRNDIEDVCIGCVWFDRCIWASKIAER